MKEQKKKPKMVLRKSDIAKFRKMPYWLIVRFLEDMSVLPSKGMNKKELKEVDLLKKDNFKRLPKLVKEVARLEKKPVAEFRERFRKKFQKKFKDPKELHKYLGIKSK